MKPQHLTALLALADYGMEKEIRITTIEFSRRLGFSQQSASRLLSELEKQGLIRRAEGIVITEMGKDKLRQLRLRLDRAMIAHPRVISGMVKTGLGEGAYYMAQEGYRRQFERKLGYKPFAGTLNLTVEKKVGDSVYADLTFFAIEGFSAKGRTFGGLRAKRCTISANGKKMEGALIIPDRTSHGAETIEVIAPINLRQKLKLKEKSKVRVEF
ncbi:MAG TPA: DUF120 domain-containing protein [Candidatus Nanoarchaeia archaeon]|nr:DUF120 domain-containing protein [Candidatus Nanoarchaeia archaeon]